VGQNAPTNASFILKPSNFITGISAFLCGAVVVSSFLSLVDPDKVPLSLIALFGFCILSPLSLLMFLESRLAVWRISLSMVAGVFVGACARFLIPPLASSIWPIAAIIWTLFFLLPIMVGVAAGFVVRRKN